ncbi:MAG: MBL fold metallo-hydrolase [Steroidobacteraceae bacterium]
MRANAKAEVPMWQRAAVASWIGVIAVAHPTGLSAGDDRAAGQAGATSTRLITLGTAGGPLPRKDRTQSSSLLAVQGALYLIDAGDGVTRRIVEAERDFRKVGKIFITHGHGDHTMGLASLLGSAWEFQRRDPIDVYGPPGTQAIVTGAMQDLRVNAEIRGEEGKKTPMVEVFRAHEAGTGLVYQDAHVKVTAVENAHFHFASGSLPDRKYKSYAYRFETSDRVVVFTGDTGPSAAVTGLAHNADLLVSEIIAVDDVIQLFARNGVWQAKTPAERQSLLRHLEREHLLPGDVGRMAAKAGVKTVVLTHLPPTSNPNDDYQRYVEEVKRYFSGSVLVARDLMEF